MERAPVRPKQSSVRRLQALLTGQAAPRTEAGGSQDRTLLLPSYFLQMSPSWLRRPVNTGTPNHYFPKHSRRARARGPAFSLEAQEA